MAPATTSARTGVATQEVPSSWAVGWTAFAGVMLVVQGLWWMMSGVVALFNDEFYVVTQEYVFRFDVTTWGWVHLLVGVALMAAGAGLFAGSTWARVVGVVMASLAMVLAFAWMPWYPVWAIAFVMVSGFVIWALTAHGRDITVV